MPPRGKVRYRSLMDFIEVPATGELAGIASRAWYIESPPLRQFEKILPLTRTHVILNLSEPYRIFDRSGQGERVPDEFISGLQSEYLIIEAPPLIRHVGIELLPGALQLLSPSFAATSAERVQDARLAFDGIDRVAASIRGRCSPHEAIDSLISFFSTRVSGSVDLCVKATIDAIESDPQVQISTIASNSGKSQRYLISRFKEATGMTPKRYAQVLRFHRLIDTLDASDQHVDWAKLATDSGYYDQPHVIRAFRRFSGWTPAEYFKLVREFGAEAAHFVPMREVPVSVGK